MRRYETIMISDPDLGEETRDALFARVKEIISEHGGTLIRFDGEKIRDPQKDFWGIRQLAYEIRKKTRGYYVRLDYCGDGALVDEMERNFRIDDRVMKFMTILLDEDADIEAIKEEMAAAEVAEVKTESVTEESPAETADSPAEETDESDDNAAEEEEK